MAFTKSRSGTQETPACVLEVICHDWEQHRHIEIGMKALGEVKVPSCENLGRAVTGMPLEVRVGCRVVKIEL